MQEINEFIRDKGISAWSLRDLQADNVPVRLEFELTDYCPIYHDPSRMAPRDNLIIREEFYKMFCAGIMKPETALGIVLSLSPRKRMETPVLRRL